MIDWHLEQYPELGSTSDEIVRRAKAGEAAGLAILALKQTAGRGSRGRMWNAPEGNLNLSLLLRPSCPAVEAGLFSLMTGVAVVEALEQLGARGLMLKWPNDILCQTAKLAGILIDAAPDGERLEWLAIGIGGNLSAAPEVPGRLTTSLQAQGVAIAPQVAAEAVLSRLSAWVEAPAGEIVKAWLARGHALGTTLKVSYANRELTGQFAGLSATGSLLLQCGNHVETLNTGEVLLAGG